MIMKYFLSLSLFLAACGGGSTKHANRMDTFPCTVFFIHSPGGKRLGPFLDTSVFVLSSRYVFKDSAAESGGHWSSDTARWVRISDDTARDKGGHPLFDDSHRPLWHYGYYQLPDSLVSPVTKFRH